MWSATSIDPPVRTSPAAVAAARPLRAGPRGPPLRRQGPRRVGGYDAATRAQILSRRPSSRDSAPTLARAERFVAFPRRAPSSRRTPGAQPDGGAADDRGGPGVAAFGGM